MQKGKGCRRVGHAREGSGVEVGSRVGRGGTVKGERRINRLKERKKEYDPRACGAYWAGNHAGIGKPAPSGMIVGTCAARATAAAAVSAAAAAAAAAATAT